MRHLVTIQAPPAGTPDSFGQDTGSATTVASNVWASVEPLEGREFEQAQRIVAQVTHKITIRGRTGVSPKQRVVHKGRTFEIGAVINPDERLRKLVLLCVEVVA